MSANIPECTFSSIIGMVIEKTHIHKTNLLNSIYLARRKSKLNFS